MRKPLRSNPLLDQTLRASHWPSPRATLVLLIALLTGAAAGRAWLRDHTPAEARAMLLLVLWVLPLVTMAVAAVSVSHRLRAEGFQLVKQSLMTDRQVTWGLGLGTLYTLRTVLVLAFGLLPALVDDTPLGGASTALCLAGLHLAASMLGTALMLRWGWQRLGVVLAAIVCTLIVALLPTLGTLLSPITAPGCPSTALSPAQFRMSVLLLYRGLHGLLPVMAAVLPAMIGWAAGLILWRGREVGWRPRLEAIGLVLVVGLALEMWVIGASQVEARERRALVALYEATGGDNWSFKDGWLSDQPVCSWEGITCICNRVVVLYLHYGNLRGKLPSEIGQLNSLDQLYLGHNQLTELPPEIGELVNLQSLDLENNQLTELPPDIGRLANLSYLHLGNNQLSELPPQIGQLNSLQTLDLPHNQITELPPEIGQLIRLQMLVISNNQLAQLPPEIGQLTSLVFLWLKDNRLWSVPSEIGQIKRLSELDLANNRFAKLPPEIGQLTSLQKLDVSDNQLTELPLAIGLLTKLWWLDLSHNELAELPPEIGQLVNLEVLGIGNNPLSKLPPEICHKPGLEIYDIEDLCNK